MTISFGARFATLVAALVLCFSVLAVDQAEARRGGSFGSRGLRTFQSAPPTTTAPKPVAPVERSTTPNTGVNGANRQTQTNAQRPGLFNGFGGSMFRGLLLGGLIGVLLGQGFGGLAGLFGFVVQALLIGGLVVLAIRFFRSRSASANEPALAGMAGRSDLRERDSRGGRSFAPSNGPRFGSAAGEPAGAPASTAIELSQADLDVFQRRLTEVQEAFGREDHEALRRLTTPEMVSYLSEELADNARKGLRNDVSDVELLQADISESWREGDRDYATAALRYESIDVTRERANDRIVEGDPDQPTETTELWTFTRPRGQDWKLSAIQQA